MKCELHFTVKIRVKLQNVTHSNEPPYMSH